MKYVPEITPNDAITRLLRRNLELGICVHPYVVTNSTSCYAVQLRTTTHILTRSHLEGGPGQGYVLTNERLI
jgi:hypothetical protein